MKCQICDENVFKYKCPKCNTKYCSLNCFKSEKHKKIDSQATLKNSKDSEKSRATITKSDLETATDDPSLNKILLDEKIKEYLLDPTIQLNILLIYEILNEVSLTNEYNKEGRLEIANKKLSNLRSNGVEQNIYLEEFIQHLLSFL